MAQNAERFDVLHTHFGYEGMSHLELTAALDTLATLGKPLVLTVHDLQNPHLEDDVAHHDHMAGLVAAASAIVTLTPGAATEIGRRWGRVAEVIPHPHIVPLAQLPRTPAAAAAVGLHLGDLRARVSLSPIADALRHIAAQSPLVIDIQDDAWASASTSTKASIVSLGAAAINIHGRLCDSELYAAVRRTRVQILPYGRGTHSGWLEMCLDLGVGVAAPDIGYLIEQHPGHERVLGYDPQAPDSLVAAVERLLEVGSPDREWVAFRAAERERISASYAAVYQRALANA